MRTPQFLTRALTAFLDALCTLNKIQFSAPWNPGRPSCRF